VQASGRLEGFKPLTWLRRLSLSRERESWSNKVGRATRQRLQLAGKRFEFDGVEETGSVAYVCRYAHRVRTECGGQFVLIPALKFELLNN
jgi:hypothetical protein